MHGSEEVTAVQWWSGKQLLGSSGKDWTERLCSGHNVSAFQCQTGQKHHERVMYVWISSPTFLCVVKTNKYMYPVKNTCTSNPPRKQHPLKNEKTKLTNEHSCGSLYLFGDNTALNRFNHPTWQHPPPSSPKANKQKTHCISLFTKSYSYSYY